MKSKFNTEKVSLVLLLPIVPPVSGGGAQYAEFLCKYLPKVKSVGELRVITERYPDKRLRAEADELLLSDKVSIRRCLTRFNGLSSQTPYRYIAFGIQNLEFLFCLRSAISPNKKTILLVHSAFLFHKSSLLPVLRRLKRARGDALRIILDTRDPSTCRERLQNIDFFDGAIACGARLTLRLRNLLPRSVWVREIPVPMEFYQISDDYLDSVLKKFKVRKKGYIFSPNGIRKEKNFPMLYDAWNKLIGDVGTSVDLVVAGRDRDWHPRYIDNPCSLGKLIRLGSISNREVRALMKGASAVVIPSKIEGLPRSCLEALSVGTPTLLPPGVPEFYGVNESLIANINDADSLSSQLDMLIKTGATPTYDIGRHEAHNVIAEYSKLIDDLVNDDLSVVSQGGSFSTSSS